MTEKRHEEVSSQSTSSAEPKARRLRGWFWLGFAVVFVGMALCGTMYSMHPSGKALVACRLWEYYLAAFRSQFSPSNLGPASGGGSAMIETLLSHVFVSCIGGGAMAAGRWLVCRIKG